MQLVRPQVGTERVTNEQHTTPYYLCNRRISRVGWAIRARSSYWIPSITHYLVKQPS